MRRSSIRRKILASSSIISALSLIMIFIGVFEFNKSKKFTEQISPINQQMVDLVNFVGDFSSYENNLEEFLLIHSEIYESKIEKDFDNLFLHIESLKQNKYGLDTLEAIEKLCLAQKNLTALLFSGSFSEISTRNQNETIIDIYSGIEDINRLHTALSERYLDRLQFLIKGQQSSIRTAILEFFLFGFVTLALYIILGLRFSFRLSRPIVELKKATTEIYRGNFNIKARIESTDEISELAAVFNKMTVQLRKSIDYLKDSEEKFRTIAEKVPGMVYQMSFRLDDSYYFKYLSPRSVEIFGLPPDTENYELGQFIHPEDRDDFITSVMNAVHNKADWNFEGRLLLPDGEVKWFRGLSSPVNVGDETIYNGIFLDITEGKKAEKSLKREVAINIGLAELSQKLISAPDDISEIAPIVLEKAMDFTGSEHGYVSFIDPQTKENVVYSSTDMMDSRCAPDDKKNIWPPYVDGSYQDLLGYALNTQEPFFTNAPSEHPAFKGLPESHKPVTQYLSVPVMFSGECIGQISLANPGRDFESTDLEIITRLAQLYALALIQLRRVREQSELETRLRQSQKMEAIGTLAGGIAHDFNNILGSILGSADLAIANNPSGSTATKHLDMILKAGLRARDLVKHILAFSRQVETEKTHSQAADIIEETLKMLRPSLPSTIEIHEDINANAGVIFAEPSQIQQVCVNLCTNAYHAMEKTGGRLEVSLRSVELDSADLAHEPQLKAGTYAQLTVCDSGPGIGPHIKGKIFDPFFTTKDTSKGTGMGLSIVHGIVKGHGGFINFETEQGKGSSFHVFLPVVDKETRTEVEAAVQTPTGEERILLIDDEEMLTQMGKLMLEINGYSVSASNSSTEALDIFQDQPDRFDLVITDQTMPKMTGSDLAVKMLQIRPDIPIILCTGYSAIISKEKTKQLGIKGYLQKPIRMNEMAEMIRKVLDEK